MNSSNYPLVTSYSHAVSRSAELLSCAKTAVKIAKSRNAGIEGWWSVDLDSLQLNSGILPTHTFLEDGISILRAMDGELQRLEGLVRRRGHTNDPTEEIASSVKRLESDAEELTALMKTMVPPSSRGQHQRHWTILQLWFQDNAKHHGNRLKEVLHTRGEVVAEQARRRKRFQRSQAVTHKTDSPLFRSPVNSKPPPGKNASAAPPPSKPVHSVNNLPQSTANTSMPNRPAAVRNGVTASPYSNQNQTGYYGKQSANGAHPPRPMPGSGGTNNGGFARPLAMNGYGSGGGYGGVAASSSYGGSYGDYSGYGMRQRKGGSSASTTFEDSSSEQAKLLQFQQERTSAQRAQEAQQAEQSLATISTMFNKFSTMLTQQAEVIDKVEDDVEAAFTDVSAGQNEISILYSIKKGNRALILKVFGLLIFFIIFTRAYRSY